MANDKFSCKEVIAHGWAMTMKYWLPFLFVAIIYIFFQFVGGVMEHYAGVGKLARFEANAVYKDRDKGDRFYKYLQEAGYIDASGNVQSKLRDAGALTLPPEFEDRSRSINSFLEKYHYRLPFPKPVFYLLGFLLWVISVIMMIGSTKMTLMAARDQEPSLADLFAHWNKFIPYLFGGICYGLAVMGGLILLIVPGVIFAIALHMYGYLVVDKGLGPIAALRRSRVITRGQRGQLFTLGLLLLLLNVAGLLCLVVGLFFTLWTGYISMAYVYDRLENAAPEAPPAA